MPQGWGISVPIMDFPLLRQTGDLTRSRMVSVASLSFYGSAALLVASLSH